MKIFVRSNKKVKKKTLSIYMLIKLYAEYNQVKIKDNQSS